MSECPIGPITYRELFNISKEYMKRPRHRRNLGIGYSEALAQIQQSIPLVDYRHIAKAVGDFLLNWMQVFYMSEKNLDYAAIAEYIEKTSHRLNSYRCRTIASFDSRDEAQSKEIWELFRFFLDATHHVKRKDVRGEYVKSPVSVAKALYILAPDFFPPWDDDVSVAYDCWWVMPELSASCYLSFMTKIQQCWTLIIQSYILEEGGSETTALSAICQEASHWHDYRPSLLKLIDECNMFKYSNWR